MTKVQKNDKQKILILKYFTTYFLRLTSIEHNNNPLLITWSWTTLHVLRNILDFNNTQTSSFISANVARKSA